MRGSALNKNMANSAQSAEIDHLAIEHYKLSAEILMETAGALSAREILNICQKSKSSSIMVLCGPGNNGGDGLVVARHLLSEGMDIKVFCSDTKNTPQVHVGDDPGTKNTSQVHVSDGPGSFSSPLSRSGLSKKNVLIEKQKNRLRAVGMSLPSLENIQEIKKASAECSVIVDALFGVGLVRNMEGFYADLIQWINSEDKQVVSLDTPSGLDADTGQIKGQAVKANLTVSFGLAKPGFYLMHGPACTGQLKTFSIGFPASLLSEKANTHFLITKSWVASRLPRRRPTDHKAQQGHLLVLAGSKGFWGAGQLAALSAYRMGVGYVTWAPKGSVAGPSFKSPAALNKKMGLKTDVFHVTLDPLSSSNITEVAFTQDIPDVLSQTLSDPDLLKNKTAVVIGPGLGIEKETKKLLLDLQKTSLPVVVDADAITVCIREDLFPVPSRWVLTPHSGEMGRLFGITGKEVDKDRCSYAMKASHKTGCWVLLKGFHSVLASKDQCWIIPTGNAALAKAGTGDVLTGFIGALMARSLDTFSATAIASFIHGLLAEEWVASGKDKDSLMAQDLKDILPVVLQKLRFFD